MFYQLTGSENSPYTFRCIWVYAIVSYAYTGAVATLATAWWGLLSKTQAELPTESVPFQLGRKTKLLSRHTGDVPAHLGLVLPRCGGPSGGRWAGGCAQLGPHGLGEQPAAFLLALGLDGAPLLPLPDVDDG